MWRLNLIIALFFATSSLFAKDDLPPPTIVTSDQATVEDSIETVHVTNPNNATDPKVQFTPDLILQVANNMKDFAESKGRFAKWKDIPANRKGVIVKHYQVGDTRILDAKYALAKAGIGRIIFISDGNMYFEGKFRPDEKFHSRFLESDFVKSPGGEYMKKLLKDGHFSLNGGSPYTIFLQPLFDKAKTLIVDIMHEKQVIYVVYEDDKCTKVVDAMWEEGSNNLTDNPRVNMRVEHRDRESAIYAYDRAMAMALTFKEGKPIKDTPHAAPLRIVFKDGSHKEVAMTDGQFNPNIRIARMLFASAGLDQNGDPLPASSNPSKVVFEWSGFYHFVMTYSRAFNALKAAMKAHPQSKTSVISDGQFLYTLGFGQAPTLAGFPVVAPYGRVFFPFPRALRERIKALAFQLRAPGRMDPDPDGPPIGKTVLHNKSTMAEVTIDGIAWTMMWLGSLNLSNHEENAETQIEYKFPRNSSLAQAIKAAHEDIVKAYPDAIVEFQRAVLREILEHFMGRNIFEIPLPWLNAQLSLLDKNEFERVGQNILKLAEEPSEVVVRPSIELIRMRIAKMSEFSKWYRQQDFFIPFDTVRISLVLMLILKAEDVPAPTKIMEEILESLFFVMDEVERARRVSLAWEAMGFPPRKEIKKVSKPLVPQKETPASLDVRRQALRQAIDSRQLRVAPFACEKGLKAL